MTFQVIDAERNPLPNVQVHYGISNPETFGFIGFTDKNDSVAWNDLLTGKQNIYVCRSGDETAAVSLLHRDIAYMEQGFLRK